MNVEVCTDVLMKIQSEVLVLPVFSGTHNYEYILQQLDMPLGNTITRLLEEGDFYGRKGETYLFRTEGALPAKRVLLIGLGKKDLFDLDGVRETSAIARKVADRFTELASPISGVWCRDWSIDDLAQAWVEGAVLGEISGGEHEGGDAQETHLERLILVANSGEEEKDIRRGSAFGQYIAEGVNLAREISNSCPASMTPQRLAEKAKEVAKKAGLKFSSLSQDDIRNEGLGGLMAVAKGSGEPPAFLILEHDADVPDREAMVLIGKGITFDSGGLDLKTSGKMEKMKYDKAGAAAVLGSMQVVARLHLPVHVVGLIPAAENLPSGTAFKPSDIIQMAGGKTVEVKSTDAEGRLILADALSYARRYNPEAVVDLATLTGACVVALGKAASGLFSNNLELLDQLRKAGDRTGERVWPLPLYLEYREQLKSRVADLRNSAGREGGACTAAAFLEEFVDYKWAHVDIAGTAWDNSSKKYNPKEGATGVGVRLIIEFLRDCIARR